MIDPADFSCNRLDQIIDLRHPLAVLSSRMPWQELEASVSHLFVKKVRAGKVLDEADRKRSMSPIGNPPVFRCCQK
jgi:hypothetical protein